MNITFITEYSIDIASTRSRILALDNFLKTKGIDSCINGNIEHADVVVFQKGDRRFLFRNFVKSKKLGKFIVFDVDDWYDNGYFDFFIKWADLVFVGSEFLKTQWSYLNEKIYVLDDPLDVLDLNLPLPKYDLHRCNIGWFGNITNLPVLKDTKLKNVTTITKGGDIEWSLDTIDENIRKFDLIVLPQDKTKSGSAKGNCRMLKSIYLGVPVLVSDLTSYIELTKYISYPIDFIVKHGDSWEERVCRIKNGDIKFNFDFLNARRLILDKYSKSARGQNWLTILKREIPSKKWNLWQKIIFSIISFKIIYKYKNNNHREWIILGIISFKYKKQGNKHGKNSTI